MAIGSLKQLQKYPAVGGLILSFFLIYLAANAVQSTWSFFGIKQFNWTPKIIGLSLGLVGLLVGAVQGGLIRIVNPWLGNKKSVYAGLALYAIGLFLFSTATQSWMMFLFLVPYCLGGICGPALQSIISGQVPRQCCSNEAIFRQKTRLKLRVGSYCLTCKSPVRAVAFQCTLRKLSP